MAVLPSFLRPFSVAGVVRRTVVPFQFVRVSVGMVALSEVCTAMVTTLYRLRYVPAVFSDVDSLLQAAYCPSL